MALFVKKAYLINICFSENAIFAVFGEKVSILHFSETPLVYDCFHCFRHVRFSHGL